jgi:hypothetical protein
MSVPEGSAGSGMRGKESGMAIAEILLYLGDVEKIDRPELLVVF